MKNARIAQKQLKSLEMKFREFLQDVSFQGRSEEPIRDSDNLIHMELQFLSNGNVRLEEPNREGPYHPQGQNKFLYLQWPKKALDEAVNEAQKLCPGISKKQIRRALRKLMVEMFDSRLDKVSGELKTILDVLDISNMTQKLLETVQNLKKLIKPQVVLVPIEGLELKGSNLKIGPVVIHSRGRAGENELDQTLQTLEEYEGEDRVSYIRERLKSSKCFATVEIKGDDTFVRERAVQQVREVLHILNLFLSSSAHQPNWAKIRISQIIFNQWLSVQNSIPGGHYGSRSDQPLEFNKDKLLDVIGSVYDPPFSTKYHWQQTRKQQVHQNFERLVSCFHENDDISKRIRRAVTWYSKGVDADTPEEQFVNLAIALESLLIGNEGEGPYATTGSISQNLGERVAFLLEDNVETRMQKFRETKKLYGLRSAIVHRGEQIAREQLQDMDNLVKQVTLTFLMHDFKSWLDFQEWIARQKFTNKDFTQAIEEDTDNGTRT